MINNISELANETPLTQLARACGTDKYEHGYCPYYERHLPSRDATFNLLEIGVYYGASLKMWKQYFPNAQIYGIDIEQDYIFQEDRITTILGDAATTEFWEKTQIPNMDVIIDDGSHHSIDILVAFNHLWNKLNKGGLYIIEDLETQYNMLFGGNVEGSTVIRMLENKMGKVLRFNELAEMHIYNEIVFVMK